ncbi:MAG: putative Apolipoprotein N-acyltransferase [Acidimicrobiaceae bacterium]|nr:putative Apolipoprotein N-acyltransferase [Acidimicrobiaceae bacterium]
MLAGRRARDRALLGLAAGLAQFAIGCLFVAAFSLLGYAVLVVFEALLAAVATILVPAGPGRLLSLAGGLTLAEWVRDHWPFGGMPLGGIALGQANGPLAPLARLGGPLLVTGATVLVGGALAMLASGIARGQARQMATGAGAALLVVVAAVAAAAAPSGGPAVGHLQVALVQGGGPRGLTSLESQRRGALAATLAESDRLARGRVALVVWPEDVVPLATTPRASAAVGLLGDLSRRLGATLVAGVTWPAGTGRFANALVATGPSGHLLAVSEKAHPVPFGEYVPFRGLLSHLVDLSAVPRDMVRGDNSGMIATPAGRLAALISFEDFFPGRSRSGVRAGGELLVVATNTASYASSQVPDQELASSRLQAIGEGRSLVQAATAGVSAVIDPRGLVLEQGPLGKAVLLRADVALHRGATFYEQAGDLPVLLVALAALFGGWERWRRNRERRAAHAGRGRSQDRGGEKPAAAPVDAAGRRSGAITGA